MLRAVKNWSGFRGESNPRTWLYAILVNVFRDSLKSRRLEQEPLAHEIATSDSGPAAQVIAEELGQAVARQVSELPARQREVLVLLTWEGMSVGEVAEILEMNPANVYTTLHYARKTLRQRLQRYL